MVQSGRGDDFGGVATATGVWQVVAGLYRLHVRAFIASTTADGFRCLM